MIHLFPVSSGVSFVEPLMQNIQTLSRNQMAAQGGWFAGRAEPFLLVQEGVPILVTLQYMRMYSQDRRWLALHAWFRAELKLLLQSLPAGNNCRLDEKNDFEFVREMTATLYCQYNGRHSVDPVLFVRICLLTYLNNIPSDRQVCEEMQYNLAYRWFCRLSIEDVVPDHSSLTRIRDRLGEKTFKKIFDQIVRV